jgi:hypothetical protein
MVTSATTLSGALPPARRSYASADPLRQGDAGMSQNGQSIQPREIEPDPERFVGLTLTMAGKDGTAGRPPSPDTTPTPATSPCGGENRSPRSSTPSPNAKPITRNHDVALRHRQAHHPRETHHQQRRATRPAKGFQEFRKPFDRVGTGFRRASGPGGWGRCCVPRFLICGSRWGGWPRRCRWSATRHRGPTRSRPVPRRSPSGCARGPKSSPTKRRQRDRAVPQ